MAREPRRWLVEKRIDARSGQNGDDLQIEGIHKVLAMSKLHLL